MIPGLSNSVAERLSDVLDPRVTAITAHDLANLPFVMLSPGDPALLRLGIHASGQPDLVVVATDPHRPIGRLEINVVSPGCLLFVDNRAAGGDLHGNIRMLGQDCAAVFTELGAGYIALEQLFMRSAGQLLFWGRGATAVGCSIELEGDNHSAVIGDDCLLSSGIWIRNHDMHAVHDIGTGERINRPPVDTILEHHVWIGQNALLLNCQRIGAGSIVGAQSLVKGVVGDCVAVGGAPARVLRYQVSWGRDIAGMTAGERGMLGLAAV
jgi:hypothetical protein